jgi:hypothetical protein
MTSQNLDSDPAARLDTIFGLPETVPDEWRGVYDELVEKLKAEASGLPMQTVHTLLLERIANYYVTMRVKEQDGLTTPTQLKDQTAFWLSMTVEFNKQLKDGRDMLRETLLLEVQGVIQDAVDLIEDKETRQKVRLALAEGFAKINA